MFREVRRTLLYEDVMEQIKQLIIQGKLSPGDRLPSERELAAELGISRHSLREALKTLAVLGIVEIKANSGNFYPRRRTLPRPLQFLAPLPARNHLSLLETRKALEVEVARLAARRATPADLDLLKQAVEEFEAAVRDRVDSAGPDLAFHRALAKATQNMIFLLIIDSLPTFVIRVPELEISSMTFHRQIYQAVKSRNGDEAAELMAKHLESLEPYLVKHLDDRILSEKEELQSYIARVERPS